MKKILYLASLAATFFMVSSCSNEEIEIDAKEVVPPPPVQVVETGIVALQVVTDYRTTFPYDYRDIVNYSNMDIRERYRTVFTEDEDARIVVSTLFYNEQSQLVDSVIDVRNNWSAIQGNKELPVGNYTAVTYVKFAPKDDLDRYWSILERENLTKAHLHCNNKYTRFSPIAYSAQNIVVEKDKTTTLNMQPKAQGALIYQFYEHFNRQSSTPYSAINTDDNHNNIIELALYSRRLSNDLNINPNATEKFSYQDDYSGTWYYRDWHEPSHFDEKEYFTYNGFNAICYILEEDLKLVFGYSTQGGTGFDKVYPNAEDVTYTLQSGKVYLAYWDYWDFNRPYFGLADNNHWNTYDEEPDDDPEPSGEPLYEEPYTNWGASKAQVKAALEGEGYVLRGETDDQVAFEPRVKEMFSVYSFETDDALYDATFYFSQDETTTEQLKNAALGLGCELLSSSDGSYMLSNSDETAIIMISSLTSNPINYISYINPDWLNGQLESNKRTIRNVKALTGRKPLPTQLKKNRQHPNVLIRENSISHLKMKEKMQP